MIQIFLDNRPVIPTGNSSIKLTVENPYFTKSTSYTYDVELPLDIAENREVFGFINRIDVEKKSEKYSARLIVDNVCVLAGTAHITSVSETAVKVQLLGDNAAYNYKENQDKAYIDELELGDWFWTTWPDGSFYDSKTKRWVYKDKNGRITGETSIIAHRASCNASGFDASGKTLFDNLFSGEYPWVAYPTQNLTADLKCNNYVYLHYAAVFPEVPKTEIRMCAFSSPEGDRLLDENTKIVSFAVQPYIWLMAEKIANATGYRLEKSDNDLYQDEFFKNLFIVNANNHVECNKCLPHWTVIEWWEHLEKTFNVVMSIDKATNKMSLKRRHQHYISAKEICLNDIVDAFSVELESDVNVDVSVGNVGFYDRDLDPSDKLSEYIQKNARRNYEFESLSDLHSWAKSKRADELAEMKDVLFCCKNGRHYILTDADRLVEVDMFRDRINKPESDDIDIELKIVPAKYIDSTCDFYYQEQEDLAVDTRQCVGDFPVRILAVPDMDEMKWYKINDWGKIDIEKVLNGNEENAIVENNKDVVYIAYSNPDYIESSYQEVKFTTGTVVWGTFKYPRAILRSWSYADLEGLPTYVDQVASLSLIPIAGQNNLASNTIVGTEAIDTTVRHCIRFVADRVPDPGAIFIIRNRRFVCEKIEADIVVSRLKKLMTGYFYEYSK